MKYRILIALESKKIKKKNVTSLSPERQVFKVRYSTETLTFKVLFIMAGNILDLFIFIFVRK